MFKIPTLSVALTAAVLTATATTWAAQDNQSRFLEVTVEEVAEKPLEAKLTGVEVAKPDEVAQGVVRIGDKIAFEIGGVKDSFIYIMNMDEQGTLRLIYPNRFAPEAEQSEKDVLIPAKEDKYKFQVSGEPGKEVVKVIAINGKNGVFETLLTELFEKDAAFPKAIVPTDDATDKLEEFFSTSKLGDVRETSLEYTVLK
ncbi:MAG: DUF4384 domain-containing protein [Pseudomonadota bacterium]